MAPTDQSTAVRAKPQPMDTAPREPVLLWDSEDEEWVIGVWTREADGSAGWTHVPGAWPVTPTAWAPLPEAPHG